mgnify:FL=1
MINNFEFNIRNTYIDIDLSMYVSKLEYDVKQYIEIYNEIILKNYISVRHGDLNLKNFLNCKDGSCRIIDLDTLSYNITIRDLFALIKAICSISKNEASKCLLEYDKVYLIDKIEYNILRIICNPVVNLYYILRNKKNNNEIQILEPNDLNIINGMAQVYDILDNNRR